MNKGIPRAAHAADAGIVQGDGGTDCAILLQEDMAAAITLAGCTAPAAPRCPVTSPDCCNHYVATSGQYIAHLGGLTMLPCYKGPDCVAAALTLPWTRENPTAIPCHVVEGTAPAPFLADPAAPPI